MGAKLCQLDLCCDVLRFLTGRLQDCRLSLPSFNQNFKICPIQAHNCSGGILLELRNKGPSEHMFALGICFQHQNSIHSLVTIKYIPEEWITTQETRFKSLFGTETCLGKQWQNHSSNISSTLKALLGPLEVQCDLKQQDILL